MLLLTVGLLLLDFFTFPATSRGTGLKAAENTNNHALMEQLRTGLLNYKADYGQNLTGDNQRVYRAFLGDNPRGIIYMEFHKRDIPLGDQVLDLWGTPYEMVGDDKGITAIRSAGKDRKFGTPDDIVVNVP
ncbi:hypothetical protein SAMN05444156_2747 [Verrucomicrobium sp. GAS474]|nr:hypothetical protein SAMN05444156_2747 [Verrucomicrobium sp. GAS474]